MSRATLEASIPAGATIVLDSSAILAYLDGGEPVSPVAAMVVDDRRRGEYSRRLGRDGDRSAGPADARRLCVGHRARRSVPRPLRGLRVEPVSYAVAREAARIRAVTALRTPDATILATAAVMGARSVVTNDGRWASAIDGADLEFSLCRLDQHV